MHPIERLRYVARSGGADHSALAEETARALAAFTDDPSGLVTACRRIVDRHPTSGPMWWLASKVLATNDPRAESIRCVTTLQDDPTAAALAYELPDDMTVTVIGWPEQVGDALVRRGDIRSLVVDSLGEGTGLVRRLEHADSETDEVPPANLGGAVTWSNIVLLEASAVGPDCVRRASRGPTRRPPSPPTPTPRSGWSSARAGSCPSGSGPRCPTASTRPASRGSSTRRSSRCRWSTSWSVRRVAKAIDAMLRRTDTPVVPELLKSTTDEPGRCRPVSRRDQIKMTDAEIAEFLDGRHTMNIATLNHDGSIHLVAMWYAMDGTDPVFWTYKKAQKIKNVERDPRITCLVETGDEYEQLRGVELVGTAELITERDEIMALGEKVAGSLHRSGHRRDPAVRPRGGREALRRPGAGRAHGELGPHQARGHVLSDAAVWRPRPETS